MHTTAFMKILFHIHRLNPPSKLANVRMQNWYPARAPRSHHKGQLRHKEAVLPVGNNLSFHFGVPEFFPVMHLSSDTKEQMNCSSITRIRVGVCAMLIWINLWKDNKINLESQIFFFQVHLIDISPRLTVQNYSEVNAFKYYFLLYWHLRSWRSSLHNWGNYNLMNQAAYQNGMYCSIPHHKPK